MKFLTSICKHAKTKLHNFRERKNSWQNMYFEQVV